MPTPAGGTVTNSQLFAFTGGAGPLPLVPQNGNNQTLLTITNGLLDQTSGSPDQASGNEVSVGAVSIHIARAD